MTEKKIPRVLLAAPSSNSGKTLLTCALLDALNGTVMENVCANAQNVLALSRRTKDGADLLLLENLNYDPEEAVSMVKEKTGSFN